VAAAGWPIYRTIAPNRRKPRTSLDVYATSKTEKCSSSGVTLALPLWQ